MLNWENNMKSYEINKKKQWYFIIDKQKFIINKKVRSDVINDAKNRFKLWANKQVFHKWTTDENTPWDSSGILIPIPLPITIIVDIFSMSSLDGWIELYTGEWTPSFTSGHGKNYKVNPR